MCGITGFYSFQNKFSEENLRSMTQALAHRGPDAEGFFQDGICGLGHRRLSIIDLSDLANQPFYSQNQQFVLCFNGEIYNYQALRKQLQTAYQIQFKTQSDTEVLVEGFAREGEGFIKKMNGMFAIAIYNKKEQSISLFRDRMGIKPLYYFWDEQNLVFASELKSLLQLPQIAKNLNQLAVAQVLHLGYISAPETIFKNIYKVEAGQFLKVSMKGLEKKQYWSLKDVFTQKYLFDEQHVKADLLKLLQQSIQYRLVADVPVGVFLSGGIDSSLVTALAAEQSNVAINTFSIAFEEQAFNEAPYAREVAKYLQTNHHEFVLSNQEAKQILPELLNIYDEPFLDSSAIPMLLIAQKTREKVKVTLGGDGGDELFWGYGSYIWAKRLARPEIRFSKGLLSFLLKLFPKTSFQKASKLIQITGRKQPLSQIFALEQFLFASPDLEKVLKDKPQNFPDFSPISQDWMESQAFFDLQRYLPDDLLVKVDRATMQHSLEARVPLLDHQVVKYCLKIHPHLKYRQGESKYLLKQILYDYLPSEIFKRPKWGFGIPLHQWLKNDFHWMIDENLSDVVLKRYDLVDVKFAQKIKQQYLAGNNAYYNQVWALLILHQFMRKYF